MVEDEGEAGARRIKRQRLAREISDSVVVGLGDNGEFDLRRAGTWNEAEQLTTDTICGYCGVGCTLSLHVQDNTIVKVLSPHDHDVTSGNLCIKGRFGWQFVQNR